MSTDRTDTLSLTAVCPWATAPDSDSAVAELAHDLLRTDPVRRLDGISFLGAIDYVRRSSSRWRRWSRLQHSLGVLRLAYEGAQLLEVGEKERRLAVAAALLHDVGHLPLSHSFEPEAKKQLGLDHHKIGQATITGNSNKEIGQVLRQHGVEPDDVIALVDGTYSGSIQKLFSGPFNVDTLDGITRSARYVLGRPTVSGRAFLHALLRQDRPDVEELDQFWALKNFVYRHFVSGPIGIIADEISRCHFRSYAKREMAVYWNDAKLFDALPELRLNLRSTLDRDYRVSAPGLNETVINFVERRYYLHSLVVPSSIEELRLRYVHSKAKRTVVADKLSMMSGYANSYADKSRTLPTN